jgi:hypothetical protein
MRRIDDQNLRKRKKHRTKFTLYSSIEAARAIFYKFVVVPGAETMVDFFMSLA